VTPRRRETDASLFLRWWPLLLALVAVTGWATTGVLLAHRADEANAKQWQMLNDLNVRLARVEGHH